MKLEKVALITAIISIAAIITIETHTSPTESSICNISKINKYYLVEGRPTNQNLHKETLFFKIEDKNCSIKAIIFNYNKKIPLGRHKFIGHLTYYKNNKELIITEIR